MEAVAPFYQRCTFTHVNDMDYVNKQDKRKRKFTTRTFLQISYPIKIYKMSGLNSDLIEFVILLQEKDEEPTHV